MFIEIEFKLINNIQSHKMKETTVIVILNLLKLKKKKLYFLLNNQAQLRSAFSVFLFVSDVGIDV